MYPRQEEHIAESTPTSLKDPSSAKKLLSLVASRTHWAANCFRMAAFALVLGAMLFDGLNPWAQALNLVAIIAFLYAATYVDEAAGIVYQIIEREEQLKNVSGVISSPSVVGIRRPSTSAESEIDEAWSKLAGIKRVPGVSLASAVEQLVEERNRAWKAFDDNENATAKAQVAKPVPALRVISN